MIISVCHFNVFILCAISDRIDALLTRGHIDMPSLNVLTELKLHPKVGHNYNLGWMKKLI